MRLERKGAYVTRKYEKQVKASMQNQNQLVIRPYQLLEGSAGIGRLWIHDANHSENKAQETDGYECCLVAFRS